MQTTPAATSPTPSISRLLARLDWSLELLVILLIGAEAAVAYLVTTAIFGGLGAGDAPLWPGWLFLLLLLGTNLQRAIESYRFFSPQYELIATVAVVALLLGAVRALVFPTTPPLDLGWLRAGARALAFPDDPRALPMWFTILLVAYAWYRGRTRDEPSLESAYRTMRAGTPAAIAAILATMAGSSGRDDPDLRRALYGGVVIFLALALAAVALGRLRVEQARGALTLTPRWLLTFLGPVAALVLLGALVASIFTRRFLETLLWLLTPLFRLADLLLLIVIYLATGIAWVIFTIVSFLIGLLGNGEPTTPQLPRPIGTPTPDPAATVTPLAYPDSLRYLLVAALLSALIWVLTRFLWHRRPRRPLSAGEQRESVFSWALLADGAAALLARLAGRGRRPPDPLDTLRGDPRWQHTVAIRETYRSLLRRGDTASLPRAADQTPDEYAPVVAVTAAPRAVADLTAHYDDARYSDRPATAEDAAAARAAWDRITE